MVPNIEHKVTTVCSEIQDMGFCIWFTKILLSGDKMFVGPSYIASPIRFWMTTSTFLSLLISHCLSLLRCLFLFDQVLCLPVSRTCFVEGSSDSTLKSETVGALFALPAMVGAAPGIVPVFRFHAIPRPGRSLLRKAAISAASPWFLF